jgi:hypothetical protein
LLKLGSLAELQKKAGEMSNVFSFAVEPLGWAEYGTPGMGGVEASPEKSAG